MKIDHTIEVSVLYSGHCSCGWVSDIWDQQEHMIQDVMRHARACSTVEQLELFLEEGSNG